MNRWLQPNNDLLSPALSCTGGEGEQHNGSGSRFMRESEKRLSMTVERTCRSYGAFEIGSWRSGKYLADVGFRFPTRESGYRWSKAGFMKAFDERKSMWFDVTQNW